MFGTLRNGAVGGAVAAVAVYVGLLVVFFVSPLSGLRALGNPLLLVYALFFDAHNLLSAAGVVGSSLYTLSLSSLTTLIALALPPVVLVFQGRDAATETEDPATAATQGAALVVGYLPFALLGVVLVSDLITLPDVVVAAVVAPVVYGAIGGATAALT